MTTLLQQHRSETRLKLTQRHRSQIRASYDKGIFPSDRQVVAYLPGDRHAHFQEKRFRQLGVPLQIILNYVTEDGQDWYLLEGRRRQETRLGWQEYDQGERLFHYNGLLCPNETARAMRLDSRQQQDLFELLLVMHSACVASLKYHWHPVPQATLPAVWNGYAEHERPEYQDSDVLRRTAVERLNIPMHRLGQHGEGVFQEYLRFLWQELWLSPDHPDNDTGLWLIEAQYCEALPSPLLRFEDFTHLLGMRLTNPWWLHPEYDVHNDSHEEHLQQLIPPSWRPAVTVEDRQKASQDKRQPLFASRASRIQIVAAHPVALNMAA